MSEKFCGNRMKFSQTWMDSLVLESNMRAVRCHCQMREKVPPRFARSRATRQAPRVNPNLE